MASELSKLIEDQMREKGFDVEDDVENETAPLRGNAAGGPVSAHQTLMGALRVEARVKEQQSQKYFLNCQRNVCVGGGIAIVLTVFLMLVLMSRGKVSSEQEVKFPVPSAVPSSPMSMKPSMSSNPDSTDEAPKDRRDTVNPDDVPKGSPPTSEGPHLSMPAEPATYEDAQGVCKDLYGPNATLASMDIFKENQAVQKLCKAVESCWLAKTDGDEPGVMCPNISYALAPPEKEPTCDTPMRFVCSSGSGSGSEGATDDQQAPDEHEHDGSDAQPPPPFERDHGGLTELPRPPPLPPNPYNLTATKLPFAKALAACKEQYGPASYLPILRYNISDPERPLVQELVKQHCRMVGGCWVGDVIEGEPPMCGMYSGYRGAEWWNVRPTPCDESYFAVCWRGHEGHETSG